VSRAPDIRHETLTAACIGGTVPAIVAAGDGNPRQRAASSRHAPCSTGERPPYRRRMERPRLTRWILAASGLTLAAGLSSAWPAKALAHASIGHDVGMRAARPASSARNWDGGRQSGVPAPGHRTPDSATNARGATGGEPALAPHHDGRERRRAPDSRIVLGRLRSGPGLPRAVTFGEGERLVSASGAVFHDANAPPASSLDAAGRRS